MTDLERIARAIWADRAARILAEDIAAQREEDSPGHMSYDELGEGFQRGLLSEAKAAKSVISDMLQNPSESDLLGMEIAAADVLSGYGNYTPGPITTKMFKAMIGVILNGENAP